MSASPSAVLPLQPFFLLVKSVVQKDADRTCLLGIIADPLDIPDPKSEEAREVRFYLPNNKSELGREGTLLFCRRAEVYLKESQHGLLVNDAVSIGTMSVEGAKKKWMTEKLPFEPNKINDHKIAVWQIPPRT